jgi:hypothetical protein
MDETGLDVQVLSLTTPGLHDFGAGGVDLARRVNDAIAEAIARHPTRFQGLATLPVACPDEAALELERCVRDLGFKGTMMCGRVGNIISILLSWPPFSRVRPTLPAPSCSIRACPRPPCAMPVIPG